MSIDVPTQYRVKKLFARLPAGSETLPPELMRVLRLRLRLNVVAIVPLLAVFLLMVEKPDFPVLRQWLAAR